MRDGFFVVEARCMPFADESLPPAENLDAFRTRQCDAIEAIVRLNPALATEDGLAVSAVVHAIFSEMAELEGLYFQTIQRTIDARKESFFPDDDVDGDINERDDSNLRPPIAMKFDGTTGRVLAMGVFPALHHGFHPPKAL